MIIHFTNRHIVWALGTLAYFAENMYFGWNAKPMSPAEHWWDMFSLILMFSPIFMQKTTHILIKRRERS